MGDSIEKLQVDESQKPFEYDVQIVDILFRPTPDSSLKKDEGVVSGVKDILFISVLFVILCSPQFDKVFDKVVKNKNYGTIIKLVIFCVLYYMYKTFVLN